MNITPNDVVAHILCFVRTRDISTAMQVCITWCDIVLNNMQLLQNLHQRVIGIDENGGRIVYKLSDGYIDLKSRIAVWDSEYIMFNSKHMRAFNSEYYYSKITKKNYGFDINNIKPYHNNNGIYVKYDILMNLMNIWVSKIDDLNFDFSISGHSKYNAITQYDKESINPQISIKTIMRWGTVCCIINNCKGEQLSAVNLEIQSTYDLGVVYNYPYIAYKTPNKLIVIKINSEDLKKTVYRYPISCIQSFIIQHAYIICSIDNKLWSVCCETGDIKRHFIQLFTLN